MLVPGRVSGGKKISATSTELKNNRDRLLHISRPRSRGIFRPPCPGQYHLWKWTSLLADDFSSDNLPPTRSDANSSVFCWIALSLVPRRTRPVSVCRGRHVSRHGRPTTGPLCSDFEEHAASPGPLAVYAPEPSLVPVSASGVLRDLRVFVMCWSRRATTSPNQRHKLATLGPELAGA
ncbi:hypothetical protein LZ30DRAFT_277633 [Colletotrichum cereale]|nr:hypothetical protein LZ30DRAFT_277633 [Colletotrichum cereale]